MVPNSSGSKLGDAPNLSRCKLGTISPGFPTCILTSWEHIPANQGVTNKSMHKCRQKCQGDPWQRMTTAEKEWWGAAESRDPPFLFCCAHPLPGVPLTFLSAFVHGLVGHSLICWNMFPTCPDASWEPLEKWFPICTWTSWERLPTCSLTNWELANLHG